MNGTGGFLRLAKLRKTNAVCFLSCTKCIPKKMTLLLKENCLEGDHGGYGKKGRI
jgi:hypothetical protein